MTHTHGRLPYLSASVRRGFAAIVAAHRCTTAEEVAALQWMRSRATVVPCGQRRRQDAVSTGCDSDRVDAARLASGASAPGAAEEQSTRSTKTATHLDSVDTSWRVRKAAIFLGAETVEELAAFSIADILAIKNAGGTTVLEAAELLHRHGLRLSESKFPPGVVLATPIGKNIRRLRAIIDKWLPEEARP